MYKINIEPDVKSRGFIDRAPRYKHFLVLKSQSHYWLKYTKHILIYLLGWTIIFRQSVTNLELGSFNPH